MFGKEFYEKILVVFKTETNNNLTIINDAAVKNDSEKIRVYSHLIKGSAKTVGAIDVAEAANRLEIMAGTGEIYNVELDDLNIQYDFFLKEFHFFIQNENRY